MGEESYSIYLSSDLGMFSFLELFGKHGCDSKAGRSFGDTSFVSQRDQNHRSSKGMRQMIARQVQTEVMISLARQASHLPFVLL
jgi:hypothetical protein